MESIARFSDDDEMSTRQSEKLLEIRDGVQRISEYRRFSVSILIEKVHVARFDLAEDDEEWIVAVRGRGITAILRRDAARLLRLAHELDLIDEAA